MMKAERIFEILLIVAGVVCALFFCGMALVDGDARVLLTWLVLGVPSVLLAGCSRFARGRRFARGIVLGGWLLICLLMYVAITWESPLDIYYLLTLGCFVSSTFLSGALAVLTVRWRTGWRLTLWSAFCLPWLSLLISVGIVLCLCARGTLGFFCRDCGDDECCV